MSKLKFSPVERLKVVQIFPHDAIVIKDELNTERKQEVTILNPTPIEIAYKLKVTSSEIKLNPAYGYIKPLAQAKIPMIIKPQTPPLTKNDRVTIMLCVTTPKRPENAKQFWKGSAPKDIRKELRPVRFVIKQGGTETTVTTTVTEGTTDNSNSEDYISKAVIFCNICLVIMLFFIIVNTCHKTCHSRNKLTQQASECNK